MTDTNYIFTLGMMYNWGWCEIRETIIDYGKHFNKFDSHWIKMRIMRKLEVQTMIHIEI